jgi:hypothetical protein
MKKNKLKSIIALSLFVFVMGFFLQACNSTENTGGYSKQQVDSLKNIALQLVASNDTISEHLKTFDALDFDVFSNQRWDRFKESHAKNIKVYWPDGHVTEGCYR